MKQITLAAITGFEEHGRATHKAEFLARMEGLIPWAAFCALMRAALSKGGEWMPTGRPGTDAADVLCSQLAQPA